MATQLFEHLPLVNIAVRSFLLLAITLGVASACRRRSAAVNHHIWALGFASCLLIPMVTLLLPNVALPLLPSQDSQPAATATASVPIRETARADAFASQAGRMPQTPAFAEIPPAIELARKNRERRAQALSTAARRAIEWPSPATWLLVAWCAGMAIGVARFLQQGVAVARAVRHCAKVESESWCQSRDTVARQLGVRRVVPLRSHSGAVSPMVVGCWRPVVLLPSDADKWTIDRRRQVLLHELAHVQRRDVLTQSIAGLCCAVYWFNPLAWWGAAEMKRLREIACDDVVVAHTSRPSSYAETLLNVAKEYRCRQRVGTVAMARTAQVESRIRAILDATRRRASMSKPVARVVGIAAIAISIVVGSLQLTSRAEEQESAAVKQPATAKSNAEKTQTEKPHTEETPGAEDPSASRTMVIRVLDEAGKPIPEANVYASIWAVDPGSKRPPNRNYTANERGEVQVEISQRLRILRLWPSKAGYVPQFVNFAEGTHEDGRLLPETYEFRLQPGTRLSGVIVDEEGTPVSDARVQVKVVSDYEYWGANPQPIVSTWLAEDEGAAVTDKDGRWEIVNAPAPREKSDYRFQLMVTHRDFAGDTKYGELQTQQGITTEELRAGTARLTLDRGVAVTGSITGPDGHPVTEGLVVWNDRPYWGQAVNETQIDASGKYETLRLAPGEYPITVLAPGFAPEQRKIRVNAALKAVDFKLQPGHSITIKIVNQQGQPIPEASVQIGEWRGTEAIFNQDHPNVPDSRIPRKADKDGIYRWAWAPTDGVGYRIGAVGYAMKELTLVAKAEPHTVVLSSPVTIFGRVTDAESGKLIEQFRVIPVKAFRPDFYSTDFQDGSVAEGKDGDYKIEFDTYGPTGNRYRVRIEADGYRTALGEKSLGDGDPPLEENFALEKVPALRSTVVDVSGAPVNKFTVAVGTPTTSPHFSVDRHEAEFGITFPVVGKNTFDLPATFEPQRIRAFNKTGFAEVYRERDEPIETITLRPWASVSGRLVQDDKPVANTGIYLLPLAQRALTEARFQDGFSTKTDLDGNFRFERLPPMRASVRPALGPWEDSVLTSGESVPLDLKAGDQVELLLGGDGATVTGRVVATGGDNDSLSKRWSLNYLVSRSPGVAYPRDAEPLSFDPNGPLDTAWLREPGFSAWVATRENHFVKLTEDGRMRIQGVRPGSYDLVIQLYEQPAGCLVESIGAKVIPITIAENQQSGEVSLGEIDVPCRRGPRVGSDMRAYKFTDSEGRVRLVNEMTDRYVLFHVWASWCKPCLAAMPQVMSTVLQRSNSPLTVVGLNVDKDPAAAKSLARDGGWNWAQNYLGDDSDMMHQLGISSVPAYYLIGPDGKLVGSANAWQEIEQLLSAKLR